MSSKKRAKGPEKWPFVVIFVLGLVLGVALGVWTESLTPDICAQRLQRIGGPPIAVDYVCYGRGL